MVKVVDHQSRKKAVLSATINKHIKKAIPVASEDIAHDFNVSPATIRNIFSELEEEGFLTHLYTSGGRIPTNKGYRYYVDFLLSQIELVQEEKETISKEYQKKIKRLEDILEMTSEIICGVTHYPSIVSFPEWPDKFFYRGISFILEQPEFHDVKKLQLVIRMLEDKGQLLNIINRDFQERVKVYIGDELFYSDMDDCAMAVSSYRIKNRLKGKLAVLGPMRMEYGHIIPTLEYVSQALSEALEKF